MNHEVTMLAVACLTLWGKKVFLKSRRLESAMECGDTKRKSNFERSFKMSDNFDNSQNTATQTQTKNERKCRYCRAVKKPSVKWLDPLYCSGKCRKLDGAEPLPVSEEVQVSETRKATLADYKAHPNKYHRRLDPERLNWNGTLTREQLKQAGLRANREPIPGDWDFVSDEEGGQENE